MEGSPGSGDGSDGKRRRPQPPILDLKATEVTAQAASAASAAAASGAPATGPAEAVATAQPEPEGQQSPSVEPGPAAPAQPPEVATATKQAEDPQGSPGVGAAETIQPHAIEAEPAPPHTATAVPPTAPPPRRKGGYALVSAAGAIFGAAAMLAGAWLVGMPARTDERTDTAARIALLETQLGELAARPAAVAAPDNRVVDLAARIAAAEQAVAQVKALEARLAQAEAALGRTPQGAADPELGKRIAAVDEAAKSLAAALADLRRRVDEVATVAQAAREAAARMPSTPGAPSAAVAGISTEIQNLGRRIAALEVTAKELQTGLASANATAKELQAGLASANAPDRERDRVARFAAATLALRQAVEAGAPFAGELAAVKALSEDAARLAPLEPFAAAGVPSAATLARELPAVTAAAKPPAGGDSGNTGFFERLQQGAARLVRIRPADAPAPADAGDVIGRVRAAAARGDFEAALAEAEKLPPAARAPLEPWLQKVRARNAALAAARDLARAGLEALASREPVRR